MIQVTVIAVGPAQIALIRVGLAAKSLAAGTLDVSCSTGRCETGSVGFEGVNQRDDSEMGRTDWEPVVAPALAAIRAIWWYQPWCFLLKVFEDQLNHLGIFMLAITFTWPQQCLQTAIAMFKTPSRSGTTHVILEPLDFVAKLAALVAIPRVNLTRFLEVFAPNS